MATVIRQPKVSIALQSSNALVGNTPQRILCVGQKNGGTATAGALVTNIQNDGSEDTLFGADSMIANMIRNVRLYNKVTRVDAISLDDAGGGSDANGNISFTGTATEAGEVSVHVAGTKYTVSAIVGDTATAIAAKVDAAINADTRALVNSSPAAGVLTLTAVNAGLVGNTLPLAAVATVAGVTIGITNMAGGATDPTLTSVFDPIENERYQTIVWAYSDLDTVKDFLDARWNSDGIILDGVAIYSIDDTFANLDTLGNTHNSQSLVILGDEITSTATYDGGSILAVPYVRAAQFAAIRGLRLTDDANIGQFVISRDGSLDRFGGMAIASLPYFNTPVPQLPLQDDDKGFSDSEIEALLEDGVSVLGENIGGNEIIMGEMVTTYKTDAASNEDVTFKFLNYVDTSSVIREYYFNNLKARFAQSRLTEGALIAGRAMANPALIEAFCTQLYQELAALALVQEGETALQFYKENLVVTVDLAEGKVTIQMQTPIVTQLRTIIATIQVAFSAEG